MGSPSGTMNEAGLLVLLPYLLAELCSGNEIVNTFLNEDGSFYNDIGFNVMNDPSTRKHVGELPCCIRLKVEVVYDLSFFEDIGEKNEAKSIARIQSILNKTETMIQLPIGD